MDPPNNKETHQLTLNWSLDQGALDANYSYMCLHHNMMHATGISTLNVRVCELECYNTNVVLKGNLKNLPGSTQLQKTKLILI